MKKTKVGDKFIIEVGSIIKGAATGSNQYIIKGFDKLILDDKGLGLLERLTEQKDFNSACRYGAECAWDIANAVMKIPIQDRSRLFGISHNKASFKDISERFSIFDAVDVIGTYQKESNISRRDEIQNKLAEFAEENGFSMNEIKVASKAILKKEGQLNK